MVAVSAAASTAFVVIATVVTTIATATAAAAALMAHVVQQVLDLFFGSLAVFEHHARELQRLVCQWMVGIQRHPVVLNLRHTHHEVLSVLVLHRYHGTGEDIGGVELTVDKELLAWQFMYAFGKIFAKSLRWFERKLELLALWHIGNALFETVEREAESGDKLEGIALLGLFYQFFLAVIGDGIELVTDANVLVLLIIHYNNTVFSDFRRKGTQIK